jgi:hypothetical protein
MRIIRLQPPSNEEWKRWIQDCENATQKNVEAVKQGEKPEFNSNLYRRKKSRIVFSSVKMHPFMENVPIVKLIFLISNPAIFSIFALKPLLPMKKVRKFSAKIPKETLSPINPIQVIIG